MAQKKKSFMDNFSPAMQFISTPAEVEQETTASTPAPVQEVQAGTPATPPPGYKMNPLYVETKSRRLQMLIQPSLHARIQKCARQEKRSVNDMMHLLLEAGLEKYTAKS